MLKEHLTALAQSLATHRGVDVNRVSWWVFGDNKIIARLLSGVSTITTDRYEMAMVWFVENWPDDLSWPEGVPSELPFIQPLAAIAAASPDQLSQSSSSTPPVAALGEGDGAHG